MNWRCCSLRSSFKLTGVYRSRISIPSRQTSSIRDHEKKHKFCFYEVSRLAKYQYQMKPGSIFRIIAVKVWRYRSPFISEFLILGIVLSLTLKVTA